MENKFSTRMIVEAGIMIAFAYILSMLKIFQAPMGGSVTAGSMIPIFIFAIRWGGVRGMLVGAVYGMIQFILGPKYSMHIVSILFDYSVAFAFLGVVGFFKKSDASRIMGIALAVILRYIAHVISGVVVFASFAPEGTSPLLYSLGYNGWYLSLEFIISIVIFVLLSKTAKDRLFVVK